MEISPIQIVLTFTVNHSTYNSSSSVGSFDRAEDEIEEGPLSFLSKNTSGLFFVSFFSFPPLKLFFFSGCTASECE